ncbi:putative bifunctional diguanylate cyclase/phosphodiesterase [Vibrio sp. WJH972]
MNQKIQQKPLTCDQDDSSPFSNPTKECHITYIDPRTSEKRHMQSLQIPYVDISDTQKTLVIEQDITELISQREDAHLSKSRLEHVLEVSKEGIWEWHIQTDIAVCDDNWHKLCGTDPGSQTIFSEYEDCILPEDKGRVYQAIVQALNHNQVFDIEYRIQRPDGEVIWVWDRGKIADVDADGNPTLMVGIALEITRRKNTELEITKLAYFDHLTGLINRSQILKKLNQAVKAENPAHSYSAVLQLDIDKFKLLNDCYGNKEGDNILVEVANRIQNTIEDMATIARYERDEYIILFEDIDTSEAAAQAKIDSTITRLFEQLSQSYIISHNNMNIDYRITCSVGGILFNDSSHSCEELLSLVKYALIEAKNTTGNSLQFINNRIIQELTNIATLQKDMIESLTRDDFTIHLQPQYNTAKKIIGAEALVRWQHPTRGLLLPWAFLHIAEDSNLIIPIGNRVLELACKQLSQWHASDNTRHLTLSVNISAKQIWQESFVNEVIQIIDKYEFKRSQLTLEITESLLIEAIDDAHHKVTQLKDYGLSISLDDFGTGFSSLSHLRTFPVDEIKIDKSFVDNLNTDPASLVLVKSIVDLAKNFNLRVVCEGIEQQEQLDILMSIDAMVFQGYLFSKPITITEFEHKLIQ